MTGRQGRDEGRRGGAPGSRLYVAAPSRVICQRSGRRPTQLVGAPRRPFLSGGVPAAAAGGGRWLSSIGRLTSLAPLDQAWPAAPAPRSLWRAGPADKAARTRQHGLTPLTGPPGPTGGDTVAGQRQRRRRTAAVATDELASAVCRRVSGGRGHRRGLCRSDGGRVPHVGWRSRAAAAWTGPVRVMNPADPGAGQRCGRVRRVRPACRPCAQPSPPPPPPPPRYPGAQTGGGGARCASGGTDAVGGAPFRRGRCGGSGGRLGSARLAGRSIAGRLLIAERPAPTGAEGDAGRLSRLTDQYGRHYGPFAAAGVTEWCDGGPGSSAARQPERR